MGAAVGAWMPALVAAHDAIRYGDAAQLVATAAAQVDAELSRCLAAHAQVRAANDAVQLVHVSQLVQRTVRTSRHRPVRRRSQPCRCPRLSARTVTPEPPHAPPRYTIAAKDPDWLGSGSPHHRAYPPRTTSRAARRGAMKWVCTLLSGSRWHGLACVVLSTEYAMPDRA
jgi:hypothetical protein